MNNSITFKSILIPIMEYLAIIGFSIYTQVTNAKGFKKQPHCFQIIKQVIRTEPQCCYCN